MIDPLRLCTGVDIPVPEVKLTLRQPFIKEISNLGEDKYILALQLFSFDKEKFHISSDVNVSQWDILQQMLKQKITGEDNVPNLIINFLQLFFKDKINFGPRSLLISNSGEIRSFEPDEFEIIYPIILEIAGTWLIGNKEEEFKPRNEMAARIADKMKKARARLQKIKELETKGAGGKNQPESFFGKMMKVVALATANSFEEINHLTLYQLNLLFTTALQKESYELDVQSRLAGAKNNNPLVHWSVMSEQAGEGFGSA